jgi:hypothetical protein
LFNIFGTARSVAAVACGCRGSFPDDGKRTLTKAYVLFPAEIQYSKGHKYLTLVYRIDLGVTRLLRVAKPRWLLLKREENL